MVKATTFSDLANFQAVMDELKVVYELLKTNRYQPTYKGKRFPSFCMDNDSAYHRYRTTSRYRTGKYYSDAPYLFRFQHRNRVEEVFRQVFKKNFRPRERDEQGRFTETEDDYEKFCVKTLHKYIERDDPQTIQYYKDYLMKTYKESEEFKTFEDYYNKWSIFPYDYGYENECGFVAWITKAKVCGTGREISPYYSKYNVGRKETNVCDPKFYTHLFTGEYNFSLLKIKYARGGKITNAGLKATQFHYYNGDRQNWEFNSHSKKDDLEVMCSRNNIPIPRHSKYEDLAKLLKEKLP